MKDRVNSALTNQTISAHSNLIPKRVTTKSRITPAQKSAFKATQWIAVFQLLGLLTVNKAQINSKKLDVFITACFELKIINDPKMPITKASAKSWLETNTKRLLAIRQNQNLKPVSKMLHQLGPVAVSYTHLTLPTNREV